jgi:hypothetical protein
MKQIIKIQMFVVWLMIPFIGTLAQTPHPFQEAPDFPTIDGEPLRAPGEKLLRAPDDELPNDDEGEGGWVGTPVKDSFWIIPAMAVVYGIYRRRKMEEHLQRNEDAKERKNLEA